MAKRTESQPVRLVEGTDTGNRFLIYGTGRGIKVELRYEGETLWLTQKGMAELFNVTVPTINEHLKRIFADGEPSEEATIRNFRMVRQEGSRDVARDVQHYNLNAIISVGYRVSSKQGTMFRIWATDKLVQFATKGFVIDQERLKDEADSDRIRELREIIRDIRASEANVYAELRRICSMCQDYDSRSDAARTFFAQMQAKLFWAATSHTPAMILRSRIDAETPNLGLRSWPKDEIRQADALVAKSALTEIEVRELNRVTTILLDIFEDQLDVGRLTTMASAEALLNRQLQGLGRPVPRHGGSVSSGQAKEHAKEQYKIFDARRRSARKVQADADLVALRSFERGLSKPRRKRKPERDG
jgi:hypothetical protein